MVDPGLLGDVRQGQLYLQLDAIDESDRIWEFAEFSFWWTGLFPQMSGLPNPVKITNISR